MLDYCEVVKEIDQLIEERRQIGNGGVNILLELKRRLEAKENILLNEMEVHYSTFQRDFT